MSGKLETAVRLLFPDRCVICGKIVTDGAACCPDCVDKIVFCRDGRMCKKCSRPVPEGQLLCRDCLIHPHYFTACFSAALYEGELRRCLLRYKFYNHPEYHRGYARLILSHLLSFDALPRFGAVLGVPLSKQRLRQRGYGQAELIARAVAKGLRAPFYKNCVRKNRHTPAQSTLTYQERLKNLSGAFFVEKPELIRNQTILLVDDVFTTGATADEIAKILLKAGAKEIYVTTVAVTPFK